MAFRNSSVSPRTRTSLLSRLVKPLLVVVVLLIGLAVYTVIAGELRLPFGGGVLFAFQKDKDSEEDPQERSGQPAGTVAVFACPRQLPAFTQITRDYLLTADGLHTVPVVEQAISPNGLFRADVEGIKGLLGRVLRRDKGVNFAFTESDFLPKGTRPGPSAGIPPGMRGLWLDINEVQGLAAARAGDTVDLIAARSEKAAPAMDTGMLDNLTDPVMKARFGMIASRDSGSDQTRSWAIARGALVISPKRTREIATGGAPGAKPKTVEEVFLAMDPNEVALFSQALAQDVAILAAPRSGQPETETTEIEDSKPVNVAAELQRLLTGENSAKPSFGMVEVIRGGQRHSVTVPRAKKEDQER